MLTEKQRHILEHSLGLTRSKHSYRNHFVTGTGSDDHPTCMSLVNIGLMTMQDGAKLAFGGDDLFQVTEAGRAAVKERA